MQLRIDHAELLSSVQKFLSLMEGQQAGYSEMFSHIRMEGRGDHVRLTLYTRSLEAEIHLHDVSLHENFLIGVPAKTFFEIVKLLPRGGIDIDIDDVFDLKAASVRFKLPYLREDVYPQLLPEDACDITEIPYSPCATSQLFHDLALVSFVTHPKAPRAFSRAVGIRPKTFIATDSGVRIAAYPNDLIPVSTTIMLPSEGIGRAARFFNADPPGGGVFVITREDGEPTDLLIRGGAPIFLKLRLSVAKIPNLERSVPRGEYDRRVLPRIPFLMAIQRALIISDPEKPIGTIDLFGGRLIVEARNGAQHHRESFAIEDVKEKIFLPLNFRLLFEILHKIETPQMILRYYGPGAALILTDENARHYNAIQPAITQPGASRTA